MAAEKSFENKIRRYFDDIGAWGVKYFANRNTRSGIPDLLYCYQGQFIAVEVKATDGKPSPLQLEHQRQIRRAGGICIILYPDQFDDFKDYLMIVKRKGYIPRNQAYRIQVNFDRDGQEGEKDVGYL